uniref:Uncharacterized protein n=1 Tax=Anguilla anguilla TaxID=7936 RepID=A0A0E9PTJ2_ANGAN
MACSHHVQYAYFLGCFNTI